MHREIPGGSPLDICTLIAFALHFMFIVYSSPWCCSKQLHVLLETIQPADAFGNTIVRNSIFAFTWSFMLNIVISNKKYTSSFKKTVPHTVVCHIFTNCRQAILANRDQLNSVSRCSYGRASGIVKIALINCSVHRKCDNVLHFLCEYRPFNGKWQFNYTVRVDKYHRPSATSSDA